MRLLFTILLFGIASCGGIGISEESSGNLPLVPIAPVVTGNICFSPLMTQTAPLPTGFYPFWFINQINYEPPLGDGTVLRLRIDGTMYGNFGISTDTYSFVLLHNICRIGTRAPAFAGHWIYTYDNCFCGRFDILPSTVVCTSVLYPESEIFCRHHERIPIQTGQPIASLQSSNELTPPDWYEPDIEGLIEKIPQISEELSDILTELK